jgi:mannosyl-oligosaccharide alpha-1,2-mannosidase
MPEVFTMVPCRASEKPDTCEWNETRWLMETPNGASLPRGFTACPDLSYLLRPEAIESIFILYRVTGSRDLQEIAWRMFEAIEKATETWFGHAAIEDVSFGDVGTMKKNSMEVS